jgi:hypothetical protein
MRLFLLFDPPLLSNGFSSRLALIVIDGCLSGSILSDEESKKKQDFF